MGARAIGGVPVADRFATVDEYIDSLPEDAQEILERIRRTIRDVVPGVGEKISYSMPTFTLDGSPREPVPYELVARVVAVLAERRAAGDGG
jgi:hypothetical protein